jgi:hypothetical protein
MDLRQHCEMLTKPTTSLNAFLIDVLTLIKKTTPSAPIIDKLYDLFPSKNASMSSKDKADFLIKAFKEDNEPMSAAELMKYVTEQELKQFIAGPKTKKMGGRYTKKSTRRKIQQGGFVGYIVKKGKAFLIGSVAAAVIAPITLIASNIGAYASLSALDQFLGIQPFQLMPLVGEYPEVAAAVYVVGILATGIMTMVQE